MNDLIFPGGFGATGLLQCIREAHEVYAEKFVYYMATSSHVGKRDRGKPLNFSQTIGHIIITMEEISLENDKVLGAEARAVVTAFETEHVTLSFLYLAATAYVPRWHVIHVVRVNLVICQ